MQRKFIINLGLLLFLNFLIKPFWLFGIDREVQRLFPNQYGIYFAVFSFSILFNILLDLGIVNFNNKNIAQHPSLLSKYFSGIVIFKVLLAFIYATVTFIVGAIIGYDTIRFKFLLFLSINQFIISFIQYLRSNISALQLFTLDSFLSVLDKALMILFCAVLIWGNVFSFQFNLMHFIYAQTLAYILTFIIVFIIVLSKTTSFSLKVDWKFIFSILKQTYPYALLVLTMTFYYRVDAVMLDLMLDDDGAQAGVYAQAYRLMDTSSQIGVLFASLLLPMFAKMIKESEKVDQLVKLAFSLIFVPAIVLSIVCFFFSYEIMGVLYDVNIKDSSSVLIVLMTCFVAIASTYIFGTLLTANGSLKILNRIAVFGLLINLVLNLILIPKYSALGSAYASLITQVIVVLYQVLISRRLFNFRIDYRFLLSLFIFICLVVTLTYILKIYTSNLAFQIIISFMGAFFVGVVLKVIDLKKMYKIIVEREL